MISLKDEIKEILEALRDSIDDTGTDKVNFINWVDKIEDYITNLQEENKKMEDKFNKSMKLLEYLNENDLIQDEYSYTNLCELRGDD